MLMPLEAPLTAPATLCTASFCMQEVERNKARKHSNIIQQNGHVSFSQAETPRVRRDTRRQFHLVTFKRHPLQNPTKSNTHSRTMKVDTILQIVFGISAALIAVFGIWFVWQTARGKSSCHVLGLYPDDFIVHTIEPLLTSYQLETPRCPSITTTHRSKLNTSLSCNTRLDNPCRTAAHTCRLHNTLVAFPVLLVGDDKS
jgi:hypothetical protein